MIDSFFYTNCFKFSFDIIPLYGGDSQEEKTTINIGENMNSNLEEYRLFLGVQYRKPNSQIRYLNAAEKFLGFIQEISKGEIQRYIIHLNQTQKPNAVTSNIVGLNRFLEYLHRKDLRVSTPSWKQITRDTITKEQIIQLVQYAKEHCHYMEYLILLMVRDLDCRNHEIIKTRWDWIHGDKILFKDCKTGDTTGRLTPELQQALQHWRTITPYQSNPYVFCVLHGRYKGSQLSKTGWYIRDFINKLSMEVIGRRLNPQDLRASVITAEYTSYVNPKIIQLKARHRSEKTTQRYNQVDETLVATYIENGTIFSTNNNPVLKAKPEIGKDKRGYINTYPNCIPSNLMEEEEDNTLFSFSVSFFNNDVSVTGYGGLAARDRLHRHPFITTLPLTSFSIYAVMNDGIGGFCFSIEMEALGQGKDLKADAIGISTCAVLDPLKMAMQSDLVCVASAPDIIQDYFSFFDYQIVWGLTGPMLSHSFPGLVRTLGGKEK